MKNLLLETITEMFIICILSFISVDFIFGLYYRRFFNSEITQNSGQESVLNHPEDNATGLWRIPFMTQDREQSLRD